MRAVLLAVLLLPVAAGQVIPFYNEIPEPQPLPSCGVAVETFGSAPVGFENLHFHNGTLYLTAFEDGLWQASPNGTVRNIVRPDLTRSGPEMMGVASAGGALFVSQGLAVEEDVDARILRFPVPGQPEFEVFADGFGGANGLVAAPDGSLFLAHGFRQEIYHVGSDGAWSAWAQGVVPNGLALHPDQQRLVVGQVAYLDGAVEAWDLANPEQRERLFVFNAANLAAPTNSDPSAPVVPHLMDDVAVAPDGRVLATSHERFETLLGDPKTGEACVLFAHGNSPTSVRLATEFGDWSGWVFAVDLAGTIQAADIGLAIPGGMKLPPDDALDETRNDGVTTSAISLPILALACIAVARLRRP